MNKTYLAIILILGSLISKGQSHEKGTFLLSAGVGIGYYGTKSFLEGAHQKEDDNTAGNLNYPIIAQYGISDKFSLGLKIQPSTWGDDPDDELKSTNTANMFALLGEYHIKNSDKSDFYTQLSVGAITWNQKHTGIGTQTGQNYVNKYKGINIRPAIGYRLYFGNTFGVYWDLAYSYYAMTLKESTLDYFGFKTDLSSTDFKIHTSGVETSIGVIVKL